MMQRLKGWGAMLRPGDGGDDGDGDGGCDGGDGGDNGCDGDGDGTHDGDDENQDENEGGLVLGPSNWLRTRHRRKELWAQ